MTHDNPASDNPPEIQRYDNEGNLSGWPQAPGWPDAHKRALRQAVESLANLYSLRRGASWVEGDDRMNAAFTIADGLREQVEPTDSEGAS